MNPRYLVEDIVNCLNPTILFRDKVTAEMVEKIKSAHRVHVLGMGKAAVPAVVALARELSRMGVVDEVSDVLILTKEGHGVGGQTRWSILEGGHPEVNQSSLASTKKVIEHIKGFKKEDLVMVCLSGGTSSLLAMPVEGLAVDDFFKEHQRILNAGLPIEKMNEQRTEIDQVKGGGLLNFCACPNIINFIFSDIPSGDYRQVGSGPTIAEGTTDVVISDYKLLLENMQKLIPELNYAGFPLNGPMDGGVNLHYQIILENKLPFFSGGELLLPIAGRVGKGGRNMHFVAELSKRLFDAEPDSPVTIMAMGSDGTDGPTDAAGAWMDAAKFKEAFQSGLWIDDFIARYDTYTFLKK